MIRVDVNLELGKDLKFNYKFRLNRGDFVALTGKSGSGKSTLLRVLAGLEESNGIIEVFGKNWQKLPPQRREIGFVFQDYALFENMSVEENLLFVNRDRELAKHLLELTQMQEFKNRYPKKLSGGQKQRVALCRALMKRPKILLLDEPLSALDWSMRKVLQEEIIKIHKEFNLTTIMVSHDRAEIYKLANRVIKLEQGVVVSNNPIDYTKISKELKLEGEVVKVFGKKAIVSVYNNLLELEIDSVRVGDIVTFKSKKWVVVN